MGPCDHFATDPSSFGHLFENLSSFENLPKIGPRMQVREDLNSHVEIISSREVIEGFIISIRGN